MAQTFQTRKIDSRVWKTEEQWQTAKSQSVQTTTQYVMQTDQYKLGRKQVFRHQYQTLAKIGDDEIGVPQAGDCTPIPLVVRCEDRDVLPNGSSRLVDPNTCTTGPGVTVGPAPGYLKTTCIDGPSAQPYAPVASCTPGVDPATALNNWVETRCDLVLGAQTPINGTCVVGPPTQDAAFFIYTCTRPPLNNQVTPVASCGADIPGTAPNWITTTCSQPPGPNNFAATPSLPCVVGPPVTDGSFVTTTCTKPINTAGYAPGAVCVASDGLTPPYLKVTCLPPEILADVAVASGSCTSGTAGVVKTDCVTSAAGPNAVAAPVQTCVIGSTNAPDYFETTCTNPPATNSTDFVASCGAPGVTVPVAAPWITTDCRKPAGANNATVFADPRFCINDPGTAPPYLKVDCTMVELSAPTPVPPASCPVGTTYAGAPDYTVTICATRGVGPPAVPVAACTPTDPNVPPFIVTTCGTSGTDTPVAWCDVAAPPFWDGTDWVTCVKPGGANNAGPTQVATCIPVPVPMAPNFVKVTCAGSTTTPPVAVAPASCVAPANSSQQYVSASEIITCYNSAAGAYPVATPVPTCANGIDASLITTVCTFPDPGQQPWPDRIRALHGGSRDLRRQPGRDDLHGVRRHGLRPDGRVSGEHRAGRNRPRGDLHDDDDARRAVGDLRRRRRSGVAVRHHHGVLPGRDVGDGRLRRRLRCRPDRGAGRIGALQSARRSTSSSPTPAAPTATSAG